MLSKSAEMTLEGEAATVENWTGERADHSLMNNLLRKRWPTQAYLGVNMKRTSPLEKPESLQRDFIL